MQVYEPPLRDMRFVLDELWRHDGFGNLPGQEEFTPDLTDAILEEAGKFIREVVHPLNASGDEEGCSLADGAVTTPAGFKQAYRQYCEAGWSALAADPEWGGQGLPEGLNKLVEEMTCSGGIAFALYPGLTMGASIALNAYGGEELKRLYLPKMASGEWSGTMCLTEAHAGTDLGMLRTKAEPQDDGSYRVTGSKIFITAGEHDLSDNIVHLVLARLPDAPAGTKGISMFLVPKFLPDADGAVGERNGVVCTAIEHKMGIKASATCQMEFDGATGWLVGDAHRGMAAMFSMMNAERLSVGIQGLGIGEAAYQSAVWYAKDRLQGRSVSGAKCPDKPADPIIVHPDVRRMLMTMRANNEGCRALGAWVARALDAENLSEDTEQQQRASDFVALMTPIVKALFTDLGHESANHAIQVYGGHGFIRESGVEQYARDARITQIYEGTNGIQALDLVGRKIGADSGRLLKSFFDPVDQFIAEAAESNMRSALAAALNLLRDCTDFIVSAAAGDREEAGAAATDYLRLFGLVAMAYCFARSTALAQNALQDGAGDRVFYESKITTAQFFFDRILPQTAALASTIRSGKSTLMAMEEQQF